jgi:hypothetical protein
VLVSDSPQLSATSRRLLPSSRRRRWSRLAGRAVSPAWAEVPLDQKTLFQSRGHSSEVAPRGSRRPVWVTTTFPQSKSGLCESPLPPFPRGLRVMDRKTGWCCSRALLDRVSENHRLDTPVPAADSLRVLAMPSFCPNRHALFISDLTYSF